MRTVSKLVHFQLTPDLMFLKAVNNIRREYVLSPQRKSSEDGLLKLSLIDAIRAEANVKNYMTTLKGGLGDNVASYQVKDQLFD